MQLLHYNIPIEQLGKRYTLIRHLGSGGMADVYLALDEHENPHPAFISWRLLLKLVYIAETIVLSPRLSYLKDISDSNCRV